MPEMKWDGKLYRPAKFGEGMKTGTVDWERDRRRRRMQQEVIRELMAERRRESPAVPPRGTPSYSGRQWALFRMVARLFRG